jgi:hypothetical protein
MGAQAFTVAPQLRADPHHNSPGRKARAATAEAAAERRLRVRAEAALARAATAEAAAERRRRARVEAVLAHESAAKDAAVAAAVRSAETLHAERVKIVKAQNAKLNAEVAAAHGCLGELADQASAEDGSVAACINKLYERPGGVISAHVRQLIMEHLVLGVPPSAVPGALEAYEAAILAAAGEGADSCAGASRPSLASVMLIRFELAYVVLFCAAYDIASYMLHAHVFSAVSRQKESAFTGGILQVEVEVEHSNQTVRTSWTRAFDSCGLYGCNTMYAFIISCRSCFSAVPWLNNSVFTGGIRQVKVEVEPYNHTGRTFWTSAYDAYGLYVCNTMYA